MSRSERKQLMQKVIEAIDKIGLTGFQSINMEEISKAEAVSLVERHLASPEFISDCEGGGMLVTEDETESIMLNSENHLSLQALKEGLNLGDAYQSVDHLDTVLDKMLHFAFHESLGYLTPNPVDLGTGMRASLMLHLPALKEGGGIARISTSLSKLGLALRGIYGSGMESIGALYQLSNQVTLGLSEQEAITNLQSIARQIINQERSARTELAEGLDVQDTVSRSMGILQSAKIMPIDEFMKLISNVRFGVSTGLIENTNYDLINRAIIEGQPATLMLNSGKKLTQNESQVLRAQMIRDLFKNSNDKADDCFDGNKTAQ
jgi:protein arginine kinase